MALFAAADAVGLKIQHMTVVPAAFRADSITIAILLAISVACARFRHIQLLPRIAEMTHMAAVFLIFTGLAVVASYLIVAWHRPLIDEALNAADRSIGFDWLSYYNWVLAHPLVNKFLRFGYDSLTLQIFILLVFLNLSGRGARGWELLWLFMTSSTMCIVFSMFWQAAGALGYYHIKTDMLYVQIFMDVYNGTLTKIDYPVQGIIQFPSFHMALGILLVYVTRGLPLLFITFLELNILLILSTLPIGGHYLVDLGGGAIVAALAIALISAAYARHETAQSGTPDGAR